MSILRGGARTVVCGLDESMVVLSTHSRARTHARTFNANVYVYIHNCLYNNGMQLTKTIPVTDASVWSCAARESSSSSSMAKSVADAAADAAVASSFEASSCRLYIHVHVRCTLHKTKERGGSRSTRIHTYFWNTEISRFSQTLSGNLSGRSLCFFR